MKRKIFFLLVLLLPFCVFASTDRQNAEINAFEKILAQIFFSKWLKENTSQKTRVRIAQTVFSLLFVRSLIDFFVILMLPFKFVDENKSLEKNLTSAYWTKPLSTWIYKSKPYIFCEHHKVFWPLLLGDYLIPYIFIFYIKRSLDIENIPIMSVFLPPTIIVTLDVLSMIINPILYGICWAENPEFLKDMRNCRSSQIIAQQFVSQQNPTIEQLAKILRTFDNIPAHVLEKSGFFNTLWDFKTINIIGEVIHSRNINKKQLACLQKAYLEFKKEKDIQETIDKDIDQCIVLIQARNAVNNDLLMYLLQHANDQQFLSLIQAIFASRRFVQWSVIKSALSTINNGQKITSLLHEIAQRNLFGELRDSEAIGLFLDHKSVPEETIINFMLSLLRHREVHNQVFSYTLRLLTKQYTTNGIAKKIISTYISDNPEASANMLTICSDVIFNNYVIEGVDTYYQLAEILVANLQLNKTDNVSNNIHLIDNISKQIRQKIIIAEKIDRAVQVLNILFTHDVPEIQTGRFNILHKKVKASQNNRLLLDYISCMAGHGFNIEIKQNSNQDAVAGLKALLNNLNKDNTEEKCREFFALFATVPLTKNQQPCTILIEDSCIEIPEKKIDLFIRTTQKLFCQSTGFHDSHGTKIQSILLPMCKFSSYRGEVKLLYGHWLRRTIKYYRHMPNDEKKLLSYLETINCFEEIMRSATEINYSCENKKTGYNVFHEIALVGGQAFFEMITLRSLPQHENAKIIASLAKEDIDKERQQANRTAPSPLNLVTKQKNDAPSDVKENLQTLEDLMNKFIMSVQKKE